MTTFILGAAGSGKTSLMARMAAEDLKNGREVILLVPEQQAVSAEHMAAEYAGNTPTVKLEVLNFSRLANRVFRLYGGLSYNYIGKGARLLVMWRALCSVSPSLREYGDVTLSDSGLIKRMLASVTEFKSFLIRPSLLEKAAEELSSHSDKYTALAQKLSDISLIYAAYEATLRGEYDDPDDDLTLLADKLHEHNFFGGKTVYIDSFYGYTPQEYEVLRYIIKQADAVYITSPVTGDDTSPHLDTPRYTLSKLRRIALENGGCGEDIVLENPVRYLHPELAHTASHLWDYGCAPFDGEHSGAVTLTECPDIFSEAEFCAKDILRRVRGGARYRDFVVAARDIDSYHGVVDAVFEKYGIPYFLSRKTNLCDLPLYKLILASLSIISRGWQAGDVITYLKTGLTPFTPSECDTIEDYVTTWNISGRRWTDENDWTLNPDGYTADYTDKALAKLNEVNRIRLLLREPLIALGDDVSCGDVKTTVRDISAAVYRFTVELGIPDRLRETSNDENVLIWNSFCDTLDQLVNAAGDMPTDCEEYSQLFAMIASDADFGRIPATMDEVTLGSANTLRPGTVRHIYLIGANDGVFPRSTSDDKLLNDRERQLLGEIGIELEFGSDKRSSDELMYFHILASSASESLNVTYASSELNGKKLSRSSACERLIAILPELKVQKYEEFSPLRLIEGRNAAFEYLRTLENTSAGDALREYYESSPDFRSRLASLDIPITDTKGNLSKETLGELYPSSLGLSQSRLDSFAQCAFSYCCKYTLGLGETKRAEFKGVDTGNFIHHVLEAVMSWYYSLANAEKDELSDAELELFADNIINNYTAKIFGRTQVTGRMNRLTDKLRRTSKLLIRNLISEFSQSHFVPKRFEMPVKFGEDGAVPPLRIPLFDGSSAFIYGIIDRTDVFRQGDDVYVRVVDYKTGAKDFSMSDIALGINLQLLIYLFTLWQNDKPPVLEALGFDKNDNLTIVPAGALYLGARSPEVSAEPGTSAEDVMEEVNSSIGRSGLLLDDADVLEAMETKLEGRYIPVKLKSGGGFRSGAPLASLEEFGALYRQITDIVSKLGSEIKSGKADAKPLKTKRHDGCEYCPMKPVCRYDGTKNR